MVVIGVLSGKGGVGKTTITSNAATALSKVFKRKAIILDANVTSSHIRLHFGMFDEMKKTLKDIVKNEDAISNSIYKSEVAGVDIIPSPENLKGLDLEKLKSIVSNAALSDYDVVIVDSAPGFRENTENIIKSSEKVVVVANPYIPDITDALKMMELIKKYKKKVIVVINKIRNKKYELGENQIKEMLDVEEVVKIPEDEKVLESVSRGVPVVLLSEKSKASIALTKLAGMLIGEKYTPSIFKRMKWFFGA